MNTARRQPGFTLIEMILVLVVMTIILAMAAPSLRGWGQGAKLDDATRQLLATTRWTRAEAIATAATHRITFDASANAYHVERQDGTNFVPVNGEFGQTETLPIGFRVQVASGGADVASVEFYPTARSTPAVLRVTSPTGQTRELVSNFPADAFKIVDAGGGVR